MKLSGKERDGVFVLGDATKFSPILYAKGGEFGPLLEVVWLHIHPFIIGEFALT
jgi:hypothetical protein